MDAALDRRVSKTRRGISRREVVELAEACYRAHPCASISISRLCRIVGLSERGLRNAFYDVRGMSPKQCMLRERLQTVRRALRNRSVEGTTVTSVATDYGFYELGRFAGAYKQLFGEAPSATLRAAGKPYWMNGAPERQP
jgi:transcriptional regulator GlxA family with amidase domain